MLNLPLPIALGLRFFKSKRRAVLSRFMSTAAAAGIAVGVFALIVGLSAMNGFERELENRVLSVIPSAQLKVQQGSFRNADKVLTDIKTQPSIEAAAPVIELEAVFSNGRDFVPGMLYGVDPQVQESVTALSQYLSVGLQELSANHDPAAASNTVLAADPDADLAVSSSVLKVVLGDRIAKRLNLAAGDELKLYVNTASTSASASAQNRNAAETFGRDLFKSPEIINLKFIGTLKIGGQLDSALAFADLNALQQASGLKGPNQIQLKTASLLQAQAQAYRAASAVLTEPAYVTSWLSTQGKLYHDIQMIRGIMYLAMLLVMAVACFNIVSNLIMAVSEKQREIAILLTMGAGRRLIVQAFCVMGLLSGLRGIVIGLILGCAVSLWLTPLTAFIENLLGVKFLNEEIYFISFIPAELSLKDVMLVFICALAMSLAASIYPAVKAASVQPAAQLNG